MRNRSTDMEERLMSNSNVSLMDFTYRTMQTLPSYAYESRRYADEPWTTKKAAQDLARVREDLERDPKRDSIHTDGPALRPEECDLLAKSQDLTRFDYVSLIFKRLNADHLPFISLSYELEQAHRDLRLRLPFGAQKTPPSVSAPDSRMGRFMRKVDQLMELREREKQYLRARQRFTDEISFQRLTVIIRQMIADDSSETRILEEFTDEFRRLTALLRKIVRSFGLPPVDVAGDFARFNYHLDMLDESLNEAMILTLIGR